MKIVVDTNIIFSALLNTNGTIGDLLFNSEGIFEFCSCTYMRYEIEKHWEKLKHISKLPESNLQESKYRVYSKIHFVNEELIPGTVWLEAETTVGDIDKDDSDFVALTNYLEANLWTGDKELYNGLKKKGYERVYTTSELLILRQSSL